MNNYPLLIEFVPGTRISREPEVVSKLPILQNGPLERLSSSETEQRAPAGQALHDEELRLAKPWERG